MNITFNLKKGLKNKVIRLFLERIEKLKNIHHLTRTLKKELWQTIISTFQLNHSINQKHWINRHNQPLNAFQHISIFSM